jgi:hypothetical protein
MRTKRIWVLCAAALVGAWASVALADLAPDYGECGGSDVCAFQAVTVVNEPDTLAFDTPCIEVVDEDEFTTVPEPATIIAVGVFGLALRQARGRRPSGRLAL